MKASKASIGRAVDQPDGKVRFYLFHGQDESQSRGLAERLLETFGASKAAVAAAAVKNDPAALTGEAGALSLFGGKRLIWIEPASKDIEQGVAALLEGPDTENPVVAIAGSLTKTSALLKLAEGSPLAVAFASYVPEGADAERMVVDLGRRYGLKISAPVAMRLAESANNDRAIIAQELQKLALYLDSSPHAPKALEDRAIDEVGVDSADGDVQRLADLAMSGEIDELAEELARMPAGGSAAIPVVRSLQRRLLMLAPVRARIERGERPDAVMASLGRALYWKDKAKVQRMLAKWSADDLAKAAERAGDLERSLIFTPAPDREALGEELFAIARKARSL